jgi:xylan 1,4-beta-xylosidase
VEDEYFLASSSFEYAPGVPIHRSTDLRTWQLIGHALGRPSQLSLDAAPASGGVFAPTLRHHAGHFWLITSNLHHRLGMLLVTAEDPAGPWSEPVWIPDALGIDPDLAWDEAGTCWLTWAGFRLDEEQGVVSEGIVQAALDPATGTLATPARPLWAGTGGSAPEGPHLYRRGDLWYLVIAEGGTERGHAATVARAPSVNGPFESAPDNPLLTARGSASPVQSTGHADLVQRPDGNWASVWLGVRPRGTTPGWHVLGRETFASAIVWEGEWPRLGEPIEPEAPTSLTEELTGPELPLSWIAPGRFPSEVLSPSGDGAWELTGSADRPAFVGRRQQHLAATMRARVRADGGTGGLEARIDPDHAVAIEVNGTHARAVARIGRVSTVLGETPVSQEVVVELRVLPSHGNALAKSTGPDEVVVGVMGGEGFVELGRLDGRYLSTEVAGGFTGRMLGVSCTRGRIILSAVTYEGTDAEH